MYLSRLFIYYLYNVYRVSQTYATRMTSTLSNNDFSVGDAMKYTFINKF